MDIEGRGVVTVSQLLSAMPTSVLTEAVQVSVRHVIGDYPAAEIAALKPFELAACFQAAIRTPNPPEFNPRDLGNIAIAVINHLKTCLSGRPDDDASDTELIVKRARPLEDMALEELLCHIKDNQSSLFSVQRELDARMRHVELATRGQWVIPLSPRRKGSFHTPNINIERTVDYVAALRTPRARMNARVRTTDSNVRVRPITIYKALGISQEILRHPYYDLPVIGTDGHYDISSISVARMAAVAWGRDVKHRLLPLQQPYTLFMRTFTNPDLPYPWENLVMEYEAAKAAGEVDETVRFFRRTSTARQR